MYSGIFYLSVNISRYITTILQYVILNIKEDIWTSCIFVCTPFHITLTSTHVHLLLPIATSVLLKLNKLRISKWLTIGCCKNIPMIFTHFNVLYDRNPLSVKSSCCKHVALLRHMMLMNVGWWHSVALCDNLYKNCQNALSEIVSFFYFVLFLVSVVLHAK